MAELKTKYKLIEFDPVRDEYNRDGWVCQNRKHGTEYGLVMPHEESGQWSYITNSLGIIFLCDTLTDIAHFLKQLNAQPSTSAGS